MSILPALDAGPCLVTDNHRRAPLAPALLTTFLIVAAMACVASTNFPNFGEDSLFYRNLALLRWDRVPQPFSARFLQPLIVHGLWRRLHWPIDPVFAVMALLDLAGSVFILTLLLARLNVPPLLLAPAIFGTTSVRTFQLIYMPDQFYTSLVAVFFLLLANRWWTLSAGWLVVLFCARESTILLGISTAVVLLPRANRTAPRQWRPLLLIAAATVTGILLNRSISAHGAGNLHHVSALVYLLVKAPFNFFKNVLGVVIWTNTLAEAYPQYVCKHPLALPRLLHVGGIHAVGIAEWSIDYPCYWIFGLLSTFGVLLPVLLRELWLTSLHIPRAATASWHQRLGHGLSNARRLLHEAPLFVQIAAVYGLVSFAIVPLLGSATGRYVYYAWPAFWLTGLLLLSRRYLPIILQPQHRPAGWMLLLIHLLLVWLTAWSWGGVLGWLGAFTPVLLAAALQTFAWILLRSLVPAAAAEPLSLLDIAPA